MSAHPDRTNDQSLIWYSLINTASIAYGRPPWFTRYAPNQPAFSVIITSVVADLPNMADQVGDQKVLEWGSIEGTRTKSGETWHDPA